MRITVNRVWLEQTNPPKEADSEIEEEDFDPTKINPEEDYNLIKVRKSFLLKDIKSIEAPPPMWANTYSKLGTEKICQVYFYNDDPIAIDRSQKEMEAVWFKFLDDKEHEDKYGL